MNDPRVVELIYRIEHTESFDYSNANPLEREESIFRISVKDNVVHFKMKEPFRTEKSAREAVAEYISKWEFCALLENGPDSFRLVFRESKMMDVKLEPSTVNLRDTVVAKDEMSVLHTVGLSDYPSPPSGPDFNPEDPNVDTMFQRYMACKSGREPLTGMAYFCLTMLEDPPKPKKEGLRLSSKRKAAAKRYCIEENVLAKIGHLCATKGGREAARKSAGVSAELTEMNRKFLDESVRKMILRAAEKAHPSGRNLPMIALSDLPSLSGKTGS